MGGEKLKTSKPYTGVFSIAIFLCLGFFVCTSPVSAQDAEPLPERHLVDESTILIGETPAQSVSNGSASVFVVIRMVLVLALSALAIYGVFFFIKRASRPQENRDPHLKVLARVPLSNDSYAAVISVGARAWLVGGGSGNVNVISEISENESLETMLLDEAKRAAEAGARRYFDFGSLLRRFDALRFGASNESKGQSGNFHMGFLRKQRERLRGL